MSLNRTIEFIFNNITDKINLSVPYLLQQPEHLKSIIKNECKNRINFILFEDNIILYDIENDIFINTVQDLVENKTIKCKIIIKPIYY